MAFAQSSNGPTIGVPSVVRLCHRKIVAEAVTKLGVSGPIYKTRPTAGGFIVTAEASLPLHTGAGHGEVIQVDGDASFCVDGAEENAAIMLFSFLKNSCNAVIDDCNWTERVNFEQNHEHLHRRLIEVIGERDMLQAMARKLKHGWSCTVDDMGSAYNICKNICNGEYGPVGTSVPAEEAMLRKVYLLSEWIEGRADESSAALDDVCGTLV